MPFFSVIICIYNLSQWINRSVNFILRQDFLDYEILLIDDGSTDESASICYDLEKKYSNIRLISQNNQGVGYARNAGIKNAKGKYICFFDLDDKIHNDWLENIYKLIDNKNPDFLIYSYKELNPKLNVKNAFKFEDRIYESNTEIKTNFIDKLSGIKFNNGFVWNKVYKRDFLLSNNIQFPALRIQQDEVFNHTVYKYANSLITSSKILYDYYIYDKGNTRNTFIPDRIKIFVEVKTSFLNLTKYWQLNNSDLNFYIHSRFVKNSLYNRNPKRSESGREYRNKLFNNDSLNESAIYMLENSSGLKLLEKLYINGIIKKSHFLFSLADWASQSISKGKDFYRWLFRRYIQNTYSH